MFIDTEVRPSGAGVFFLSELIYYIHSQHKKINQCVHLVLMSILESSIYLSIQVVVLILVAFSMQCFSYPDNAPSLLIEAYAYPNYDENIFP